METQSLQLVTRCEQRSTASASSNLEKLISEWIVRFALNAGVPLDASAQANYRTLWLEGFSDLAPDRLRAAFVACMRSHPFPKMPTVADVRSHLTKAEESATNLEAEQKWQQVLAYAQTTSPDYAGRPIRFKEQTRAAINAAGGLDWIRDCSTDDLQWAKKRFLEAYVSWSDLDKNQFLLPDGEAKNLLAGAAEKLLPPSSTYDSGRARSLAYAEKLKSDPAQQPNIKRAIRAVAGELAPRPPMRSLEEQKKILRDRGLLP